MAHHRRTNGPELVITDARAQALAAQQRLATADSPFAVIACPGAGKTRLIVERHLTRPVPVRKGRAITSFTRVAATEIHRRCATAGRHDLADHPHFIGTLDTFLWLHLVRPFLPPDRTWHRLESWRDAPTARTTFTCDKQPHNLADIDFDYDPTTNTWTARPTGAARRTDLPTWWDRQAVRKRGELERLGYLTGAELRAHAYHNLTTHAAKLRTLLPAKYAELIVDEAQDCSPADLHILTRLHEAGLPLVIVADPDQAIYGFRGAITDALNTLATRLDRRDLTHNWRSTTVICALAATLRTDPPGRIPDSAVADHRDAPHPMLIYTSNDRDAITADFINYAAKIGIDAGGCLVLSYARGTLPKTYTGPAKPPNGRTAALAWAVGIITEYPTTHAPMRKRAHDVLARTVLRWWYPDGDDLTVTETLATHNLDPANFERLLHRVATAMPTLDQRMSTWVPAATAALDQSPPAVGAVRSRARLRCPQANRGARSVAGLPPTAAAGPTPRLSTVHQAKGDQAEAVLLLMPPSQSTDRTLMTWQTGQALNSEDAEAIRVVYVAVTRARRLLALAVPAAHVDQLRSHLERHEVPTELR